MEITGIIVKIVEHRSGNTNGKDWTMKSYLIETQEQYPRRCVFKVFGEERIKNMNLQPGEVRTVHIDINAREYKGQWYNDVSAWKADYPSQQAPAVATPQPQEQSIPMPTVAPPAPADDLPF